MNPRGFPREAIAGLVIDDGLLLMMAIDGVFQPFTAAMEPTAST
jgi:hypothetical protein